MSWDRYQMVGARKPAPPAPPLPVIDVPLPVVRPPAEPKYTPGRKATYSRKRPRWTDANARPTKR